MLPNCNLPGEIMVGILSRLPVKSLMRFRCVCKVWYPLVTNPNFINMHLNHTKSSTMTDAHKLLVKRYNCDICYDDTSLICLYFGESLFESHVDLHTPFSANSAKSYGFDIVGSCNGLLCVLIEEHIVLWNPATRKFRFHQIPEYPVWPISMGFGFHPNTDDYKFVRIAPYEEDESIVMTTQVVLLTLRSNSWKEIEVAVPGMICETSSTACLNGFLHWMAYRKDYEQIIVSFDLGDEVFCHITIPDSFKFKINRKLLVLKESLSMIVYSIEEEMNTCFDIWVMTEYGDQESWTKKFTVGPFLTVSKPLGFWKNGEVIFNSAEKLLLYDPSAQEMNDFLTQRFEHSFEVYNYVESLVLVQGAEVVEDTLV